MNRQDKLNALIPQETPSILSAEALNKLNPLTDNALDTVLEGRRAVKEVFKGTSDKFIIGIGSCGVRLDQLDGRYAFEAFAEGIKDAVDETRSDCIVLMRANWEKPRINTGWRGIALDGVPNSEEITDLNTNLELIYRVYGEILDKYGIPLTSELLSPEISKSLAPLISMGWIGARNAQSQTSRELMNVLNLPAGVKHTTDGNFQNAIDAMNAIENLRGESTLGDKGLLGNSNGTQGILRGSSQGPNYDNESIKKATDMLKEQEASSSKVIVDCNHANSGKDQDKQGEIALEVAENPNVSGVLIEADVFNGRDGKGKWGYSITDPCIGVEEASNLIKELAKKRRII